MEKGNLFNLYTNLYCQRQTGDIHSDKMRVQQSTQAKQSTTLCLWFTELCVFLFYFGSILYLHFLLDKDRLKKLTTGKLTFQHIYNKKA